MPQAFSYLRLSSAEQARGDGLRRQLDASRAFALAHGLTLVEKDELRDVGVSGFRGLNAAEGALAGFLQAIRSKKIKAGSYLLIENLDRLSRQAVFKSFGLFSEILSAGIRIVTLSDQRVYDSEPDLGDMISSIVSMQRSHEESAMKSLRIGAAWARKREKIGTEILTGKTKAWVRAKADKSGFDLVPAKVKVVRQIFDMAGEQGLGADAIARRLNRLKVPSFAKGNGWHKAPVLRLLRDRSTLGEFTAHQMVDGKRTPTKKVSSGYFPAIIEESLFHRVQAGLDSRRQGGGGPKGANVANLFAKIVHCGVCGSPVHMINRGQPRGSRSLVCDGAKRGVTGCTPSYWQASAFERGVLEFLRDKIDLAALTGDAVNRLQRDEAHRDVRAVDGKLAETRLQRERAFSLLIGDEATDFLKSKLRDLDGRVAALETQLVTLLEALNAMSQESAAFIKSKDEIGAMIKQIQSGKEDTFVLRAALSVRLKELIKRIFLWPSPVRITIGTAGKIQTIDADRCFSVIFKNGTNRLVSPAQDDETRVVDTGNGRVVSGDSTVREELVRRYQADPAQWEDAVLIEPAG
jgi:DNA invertase Pin-like site-specific DNA recombinase